MGSPHGAFVWQNKLTMFRAHYPFGSPVQLAKTKVLKSHLTDHQEWTQLLELPLDRFPC
jgi:hypothetical protein